MHLTLSVAALTATTPTGQVPIAANTDLPPTHPKETPPIPNPDPVKLRLRRQQSVAGDGQELTQNKL